jgi:hypothetical protein
MLTNKRGFLQGTFLIMGMLGLGTVTAIRSVLKRFEPEELKPYPKGTKVVHAVHRSGEIRMQIHDHIGPEPAYMVLFYETDQVKTVLHSEIHLP